MIYTKASSSTWRVDPSILLQVIIVLMVVGTGLLSWVTVVVVNSNPVASKPLDWREVVSGPHFAESTTFFITKGSDGRSGYVVFCSRNQATLYNGMRKPVKVAVRVVEPKGALISNSFLVATGFKEFKENNK